MDRNAVCQAVLNINERGSYLEIGVNQGITFKEIEASRKVAVDPKFLFDTAILRQSDPRCEFFETTSDDYFAIADRSKKFSVIYLDGLHTVEQTLRDLLNSIEIIEENGVIVIDDVRPTSYAASLKSMEEADAFKIATGEHDTNWMGDVYKLVWFINAFMQQWSYRTVLDNHGQVVMWRHRRNAASIPATSLENIGRLNFQEFIEGIDVLKLASMSEIENLIRAARIS